MTNELEKTFFDTFGIESNCQNEFLNPSKCPFNKTVGCCGCVSFEYPQITDRILLELICIANEAYIDLEGTDIETMKNSLLENFIFFRRDVYDQVRTLFEEG